MSWKRIDRGRDRDGALGWAASTHRPPAAVPRVAALIGAIARHRAEVLREFGKPNAADAELWDVMAHLGLDPRDYDAMKFEQLKRKSIPAGQGLRGNLARLEDQDFRRADER